MMVRTQPEAQLIALTTGGDEGLRDERVIDLADPEAPPLPDHRLPPWQAAPVARRLCQLSAPARQLLEVAAVLGRSFWVHDLAEVVGQPVDRLLPSLREALDAGVIVSASQVMVFRDDLVCHVVRQGLPEAVRLALHRRIGRLLLSRGGCAQAAAGHLVRGARPGDRQALAGLDQAVSEVLPSSPQSAVQLALRALELTEPADAQRFTRTATAVDALVAAGRPAQAAKLARSVLDHPGLPSAPAARMRVTLAWVLLVSGQPCKAEAEAEAVLACPRLPAGLYADGQLVQLVAAAAGDPRLLQERAEAVLAGNGRGGDRALTGALAGLAVLAWDQGRAACALSLLRAAAGRADRMPSHARHAYPRLGLAAKLTALGEFAEAEAAIEQAGQQIEHAGDTLWAPAPAICQAGLRLAAGRLDDAQAQAQAGLGLAEQLGTRLFTPRARWVLACVALLRGDLVEAAEQVQRLGTEPAGSQTLLGVGACAFLHARLADAQQGLAGGLGHAVEVLADVYDDLPTHRRLLVEEPAAAGWLVRAALATGDRGAPRRSSPAPSSWPRTTVISPRWPPPLPTREGCSTTIPPPWRRPGPITAIPGPKPRHGRTPGSGWPSAATTTALAGNCSRPWRATSRQVLTVTRPGCGPGCATWASAAATGATPTGRSQAGPASPTANAAWPPWSPRA